MIDPPKGGEATTDGYIDTWGTISSWGGATHHFFKNPR